MTAASWLLLAVIGSAAALPLDSFKTKRDSSGHQTVEAPSPSYEVKEGPSYQVKEVPLEPLIQTPQTADIPVSFSHQVKFHHVPSLGYPKDHNDVAHSVPVKPNISKLNQMRKKTVPGRKSPKKAKKSNAELLHHLGMTKLRSPTINHHRKRLASQSRKTHHQKSAVDSKMFVIKLPPNPYYYAHHDKNGYDILEPQPKSVNTVPVNFNTNGKPSRVYHWNIPVLKRMVARKAGSSKSAVFADSDIFNIDKQVTWNDTDDDKSLYRKASYYGPKKTSKNAFRKYFAGNGKPHSFYVLEKNKKSSTVHRLLP